VKVKILDVAFQAALNPKGELTHYMVLDVQVEGVRLQVPCPLEAEPSKKLAALIMEAYKAKTRLSGAELEAELEGA